MCGIIAAITEEKNVLPILIDGLEAMRYRGYDSAGITLLCPEVTKKILGADVRQFLSMGESTMGMGHSRWATHGPVTLEYQQPRRTPSGLTVVHNGVIPNFAALRQRLPATHRPSPEDLDSEVLAQMIDYLRQEMGMLGALRTLAQQIHGSNSFIVADESERALYAVHRGMPLSVGRLPGGAVIASDTVALPSTTTEVHHLDNYQIAVLKEDVQLFRTGDEREYPLHWTPFKAKEQHVERPSSGSIMRDEMQEQPDRMCDLLQALEGMLGEIASQTFHAVHQRGWKPNILVTGCGTAHKVASMIADMLVRRGIPATALPASEVNQQGPIRHANTVFVVSQSGTTGDILAHKDLFAQKAQVGCINVEHSPLAETGFQLPVLAGPERAVASTKSTLNQIIAGSVYAASFVDDEDTAKSLIEKWRAAVPLFEKQLSSEGWERMQELTEEILERAKRQFFLLGKGFGAHVAQEGVIKCSEVAYLPATAMPAGEMKHGMIARMEEGTPVGILWDPLHEAALHTCASQLKSRGADVFFLGGDIPAAIDPEIRAALQIVQLQQIAYTAGTMQGLPVDTPRNLAKSVTVE